MDDERLISEVRDHPCLYNTKSPDYKVLLRKENAWKSIAAALGLEISGNNVAQRVYHNNCLLHYYLLVVDDCMKRWKVLRERFAREAKKKKKKSGDAADTTPPWPYYDQLLFLKEFIKHRK